MYNGSLCLFSSVISSTWRMEWSIWDLSFTLRAQSREWRGQCIQSLKRLVFCHSKASLWNTYMHKHWLTLLRWMFCVFSLAPTQLCSIQFRSFSIIFEYHLDVGGVVVARRPGSPLVLFVCDTNTMQKWRCEPALHSSLQVLASLTRESIISQPPCHCPRARCTTRLHTSDTGGHQANCLPATKLMLKLCISSLDHTVGLCSYEGVALMTHPVMSPSAQSVACGLLMSYFQLDSARLEIQTNRYSKST